MFPCSSDPLHVGELGGFADTGEQAIAGAGERGADKRGGGRHGQDDGGGGAGDGEGQRTIEPILQTTLRVTQANELRDLAVHAALQHGHHARHVGPLLR